MASTYLSRTPSVAGNRQKFTISFWLKRSRLDYEQYIFCTSPSNAQTQIILPAANTITFDHYTTGYDTQIRTTQTFTDLTGWYHFVYSIDTTQAVASDRVKIYVNGLQITNLSTSTYPTQNYQYSINNTVVHNIGRWIAGPDNYFDGLLSHFHLCDGFAYTPSAFGSFDTSSGIWKPNTTPTVSYGTNGFFLKFENKASLGFDSSGNNNHWTVNGTPTQTVDNPSNNFCTWNKLWISPTATATPNTSYSNGNLTVQTATNTDSEIEGTLGVKNGKWYYEFKMTNVGTSSGLAVGFANYNYTDSLVYYSDNGKYYRKSSNTTYGATWTANDIIGVALDCANNTMTFYKNGVSQGVITSAFSNLATDYYLPILWDGSGSLYANGTVNFGNGVFGTTVITSPYTDTSGKGLFQYSVPTGHYALSTKSINAQG